MLTENMLSEHLNCTHSVLRAGDYMSRFRLNIEHSASIIRLNGLTRSRRQCHQWIVIGPFPLIAPVLISATISERPLIQSAIMSRSSVTN
jgi:hypothetical protein